MKHARTFTDAAERGQGEFQESTGEYVIEECAAIYKEFQEMFEGFMEDFCEAEGVDSTEFMQKMQESAEDDPRAAHYIGILLSSVEYDTFRKLCHVMRNLSPLGTS